MAIQSEFYTLDGTTRQYNSSKHIGTKQLMAVWIQKIADDAWVQVASLDFDLINNAAVLDVAVDNTIYDNLEVRVADTEDELTQNPTDVSIVASIANDVVAVSSIQADVTDVAAIDTDVTAVNTDPLKTAILNGDANATATAADVVTTNADVVLTNADVVSSGTNATNAQLSAWEAEAEALTADSYASEPVGVLVKEYTSDGDGTFTATATTKFSALNHANSTQGVTDLAISKREPVFSLVTNNGINVVNGKGGATFERVQTTPDSTTVVNRYDELVYLDNDEPAIGKYGLKLEPQATNEALQSEQFDNVAWTKNGDVTVLQDGTLSSDGTKQMWKVSSADFTIGANGIENIIAYTDSGQDLSFAYEVKADVSTSIEMRTILLGGTTQDDLSIFDTITKEWTALDPQHKNHKAVELANGGFRLSLAVTSNNSGNSLKRCRLSGQSGTSLYATFYQDELGSIATSYIPTTTTELTRSRETLDADPRNFPSIVSGVTVHEVWYIENVLDNGVLGQRDLYYVDTVTSSRVEIYIDNGLLTLFSKDTSNFAITHQLTTDGIVDIKFVFDATHNYAYVDGVFIGSISRAGQNILDSVPTAILFGANATSGFEASAQRITGGLYDYAMTAEQARL